MNKMPDGSFAVDSEQFEIVRDTKAPYIPTLKVVGGGGSSELPPEVTNAVETHGMGYTTEEPVPAINITWDGDTEGRDNFMTLYKVSNDKLTSEQLIGATVVFEVFSLAGVWETNTIIITDDMIQAQQGICAIKYLYQNKEIIIYTGDMSLGGVSDGTYFSAQFLDGAEGGYYVSSLTKEASTQEVAHQIDEKYIPSSAVVDFVIDTTETLISASHTPLEVCELAKTHTVLGTVMLDGYEETKVPLGTLVCLQGDIGFGIDYRSADGKITNMFLNFSASSSPDEEDTWDFTRGRLM